MPLGHVPQFILFCVFSAPFQSSFPLLFRTYFARFLTLFKRLPFLIYISFELFQAPRNAASQTTDQTKGTT